MLLFFKGSAENDDAYKKKINRAGHALMCFDLVPGGLHLFTPMNVVKHKNGLLARMGKALIEIPQRGLLAVVAIEKNKVGSAQ
jgi:hypothetical protein